MGQWFQFCSFYHIPLPIFILSLFQYSSLSLYCILFVFYAITPLTHLPSSLGRPELGAQPGQSDNLAPLKATSLNFFGLGHGWQTFFRARAKTANNFRRISFACGNLSLIAPHFRLFQWRLKALIYNGDPGTCPASPPLSPALLPLFFLLFPC